MKKTIFTLAICAVFMSSYANTIETDFTGKITYPEPVTKTSILKVEGLNSFCKAVIKGDVEMVEKLISMGENVNEKSLGKTPAMYAARYNKCEVLKLLIKKGADLSVKSDKEKFKAKKFAQLSNAKEALAIIEALEKQ